MSRLNGKVAVITGGNSGIGLATAKAYIENGARVIITGRNQQAIEKAAAELGNDTIGLVSDAGNIDQISRLPEQVKKHVDKIDILFVNAGIAYFAPIDQVDEAHFDNQFNINVKGLYFTVQKLLPLINKGGSVILNASVVAHKGMAGSTVYAATKAAVISFGKTLARDLVPYRIRVNTISPGPISTPIYGKMGMPQEALNEFAAGVQQTVPINRFGEANEVAQAAVFFASEESSFVHGVELLVDGGMSFA